MAYFQPAAEVNPLRSKMVTIDWHLDICKYAFDLELGDPTIRTENYYGKKRLYGNDTFFANFWQDIWHIVGVTKETAHVPAENIGYGKCRDCGHCQDLGTYNPDGTGELHDIMSREIAFMKGKIEDWGKRE